MEKHLRSHRPIWGRMPWWKCLTGFPCSLSDSSKDMRRLDSSEDMRRSDSSEDMRRSDSSKDMRRLLS